MVGFFGFWYDLFPVAEYLFKEYIFYFWAFFRQDRFLCDLAGMVFADFYNLFTLAATCSFCLFYVLLVIALYGLNDVMFDVLVDSSLFI